MKQIIVITDGCSNVGISPITAASHAYEEGIVVHVIGVIDQGDIGERGALEIEQIAQAGGGLSRIVSSEMLSRTVQMMTRQTVAQTIQQAVHRELRQVMGAESIEALAPGQRAEVVEMMEQLGETAALRVALLIDTSASMKPKLRAVEDAVRDLLLSLQARAGQSEIAVFQFPGNGYGMPVEVKTGWTNDLGKLKNLFSKLQMKGTTPTGPALIGVVDYYQYGTINDDKMGALSYRSFDGSVEDQGLRV